MHFYERIKQKLLKRNSQNLMKLINFFVSLNEVCSIEKQKSITEPHVAPYTEKRRQSESEQKKQIFSIFRNTGMFRRLISSNVP